MLFHVLECRVQCRKRFRFKRCVDHFAAKSCIVCNRAQAVCVNFRNQRRSADFGHAHADKFATAFFVVEVFDFERCRAVALECELFPHKSCRTRLITKVRCSNKFAVRRRSRDSVVTRVVSVVVAQTTVLELRDFDGFCTLKLCVNRVGVKKTRNGFLFVNLIPALLAILGNGFDLIKHKFYLIFLFFLVFIFF